MTLTEAMKELREYDPKLSWNISFSFWYYSSVTCQEKYEWSVWDGQHNHEAETLELAVQMATRKSGDSLANAQRALDEAKVPN